MTTDIDALAKKFDKHGMADVIERFPSQIEAALGAEMPPLPVGEFDRVVLAGMGGSASPMDVVADIFCGHITVPVTVSRHYCPPAGVNRNTLAIVSSFSGNTEEAISSLHKLDRGASSIVVLTGGGALADLADSLNVAVVTIPTDAEPPGFQPRSAVGYMAMYISRILGECGVIQSWDPLVHLSSVPQFLRETDLRTDADDAAKWLIDRIPVVYTDEAHVLGVARPAKIKFNENSKRPAMFGAIPEINHNEMVGFTSALADFGVLYLHDPDSHPMVRHRFAVMEDLFDRKGLDHVAFREWEMPGVMSNFSTTSSRAQRVFAALMFAERCSYALALLDGIDPTPVTMVEAFKEEMGGGVDGDAARMGRHQDSRRRP